MLTRLTAALALACGGIAVVPAAATAGTTGTCFGRPVTIAGTPAHDHLVGTDGSDVVMLGAGDVVRALGGDDWICAAHLDVMVFAGPGDDHVRSKGTALGGPGDDTLVARRSKYGGSIDGGPGNDVLRGPAGQITPGMGNDTIVAPTKGAAFVQLYFTGRRAVHVDAASGVARGQGVDHFSGVDLFYGSDGPDLFLGTGGTDWFNGDDGNDILVGRRARDHLVGDAGDDVVRGGAGRDHLLGGPGNDRVRGGAGNDQLNADYSSGDDGADVLRGGHGDDVLRAIAHIRDVIDGGPGTDRCLVGGDPRHSCESRT